MNKARNRDWTSDIVRHRMRYITRDLDKYMRIMWREEVRIWRESQHKFNSEIFGINIEKR